MNKTAKRFISLLMAVSVAGTVFSFTVFAGDNETDVMSETDVYMCDFTQLVEDGADTYYGTAEDVIELDEYTTAYLTYEGTYVDADGKVYIKDDGPCNGDGKYENGSYISFTAPSDGTVTVSGADISLFYGSTYSGNYGSNLTFDAEVGSTYVFAYRKGSTYIDTLTFTPSAEEPEPEPSSSDDAYVSPSTAWDFEMEPSGGANAPALGGNAQWSDGEIVFPADTRDSGTLSLSFTEPVRNNVSVEMDITGHDRALGNQYITFSVSNSEETVAELHVHPYSDNGDEYSARGLTVCGTQTASGDDVRAAWTGVGTTHVKADIDYYARKLTVMVGDTPFEAEIPEGTVADVTNIAITVSRSGSTVASRYISADNMTVSEFESTGEQAPAAVAEGYSEETIAGYPCRVKAQDGAPAVIYLSSELRYGSDNVSQLYDARYIFDKLGERATLAAPQTEDGFMDVSQLVSEVRDMYNAPSVIVIGQSESAEAALLSGADRIVTIAGSGSGIPSGDVWAFAGCNDETTPVSDVKTMVNSLQLAGVNTRYTEYPFGGHKLAETAANEEGLDEWIISGAQDSRVVDLVLFAGQSNMAGRGDYDEATVCAAGKGYEYHAVTEPGVLSAVTEPFGKYENNDAINDNSGQGVDRRSGDMVSSVMSAYYDKTGIPMVGVQASRGGQDTAYFINNMSEMQSRFNEAADYLENAGYTIRKKLLVWCQGESDADKGKSDDSYKSNTLSIFEDLRDGCGIEDMFIVRTGHYNIYYSGDTPSDDDLAKDAEYLRISNAQQALADENDNIYVAASLYSDEYLLEMRDQYHYYQSVYNSVGKTAGETIAEVYENEPVPTPEPIEGVYELTSSEEYIDVSGLKNYGTDTYRVYSSDGSYETAKAEDGKVANETGGEVIVVPEYRFEFTSQQEPADENIADYVKVGEGSYSKASGFGLSLENYRINENGCKADENPIRVDVPEGFYDITVYRRGGCRADIYSGGTLIANNTTSSGAQNRGGSSALMEIPAVHHDGGSLDITFGNTSGNNERIASIKIARVPEKYRKPVIWVAGDSESSNYYPFDADGDDLENDKIMITGFGQQLSKVLSDKYSVSNYGQPSATVKTWYDECFESVNRLMQPGDTILVDFGINDAISKSNKLSIDEMKAQMELIFNAAKANGVTPILISPVYNGKYQNRAYFTYDTASDTNGMYEFAEKNGVTCIDLNKYTQLYVNKAAEDTGDADWRTHNYHVGDGLHLTQHSAVLAASFIAAGMKALGYETSDNEFVYSDISSVSEGNIRGGETGVKRVYSAAAAEAFMRDGTVTVPGGDTPATTAPATDAPSAYLAEMTYDGTEVRMTAKDNSIKSAALIAAEYDDGALTSLKVYDVKFENGEAKQEAAVPDGTVFYLWNSLSGMQPMAESLEYNGAAEETTAPATEIPATAAPTDVPSEPTNPPIFVRDFEDEDMSGWRQSNGGENTIMTDSDPIIGKYMNQKGGGGGSRAVEYRFLAPITDNFVFEADVKAASTDQYSADISLLGSNTTVNSTGTNNVPVDGLIFKADVNKNESRFLLNNEQSAKGSTLDSITGRKILSYEFPAGSWIHIRAICNFDDQTTRVQLTSLDGSEVYFDGKVDMYSGSEQTIDDLQRIYIVAPRPNQDFGIDNIVIRKANSSEIAEVENFHKVTIAANGDPYTYYTENGKPVFELYLPDVSAFGDSFEGWDINGTVYTTEQLKALPITADTAVTAVINSSYVEKAKEVEFANFPTDGRLVMSADANSTDYYKNVISIKITGEAGTDLASAPDDRAEPKIDWEFIGFHTMHGEPTNDDKTTVFPGTKMFCDNYGRVTVDHEYQPEISFELRNTSENYYGKVRATVSYAGETFKLERPLVIIGNSSQTSGVLFPKTGYVSDFNMFEDGMEGDYTDNKSLLGEWDIMGSNSTNRIGVYSDEDGKFMRISKNEKKDSSYFYTELSTTSDQLIFTQDIRFNTPLAAIYYKGEAPNSFSKNQTAFNVVFNDGVITINGAEAADGLAQGRWYKLVISAAVSSQKCWAKVYSEDGTLIGESETVDFENENVTAPYVYCYRLSDRNNAGSSVDVNDIVISKAETDDEHLKLTFENSALTIPDDDNAAETAAVFEGSTVEGYELIGSVDWSVADTSADGVSVKANSDTHTAVVSVTKEAAAGTVPIRAAIDGQSVTAELSLTGTRESVAFTNRPRSIMIPSDGMTEVRYAAVVRDGQGQDIPERAIEYSLETPLNGVSIDPSSGTVTVDASASAAKAVIVARAKNSGGEEIERKAETVIYSLDFGFGSGAAQDGQTMITSDTAYDPSLGFGIEGTAEDNDGYISGSDMVFKANVEPGKVYEITVEYEGSLRLERYDGYLTGIEKDTNAGLESKTYEVAVVGDGTEVGKGVLDLTIAGQGKLASVKIEKAAEKTAGEKPIWIEIGDSTVAQNPSWGYVLASGDRWQEYPEISEAVEGFRNMGRGARQLTSFYNEGLLDNVLRTLRPGDVVSISGMGTNGYDGTIDDFKAQLNYYIDSVIEMGGKVILGSYTPNGNWGGYKDKVYDPQTETFKGKRYDDFDVALYDIYQERRDDENILGYVDIGGITDELMTAEVRKAREAAGGTGEAADAAAAAKAEELLKWYPNDFNHYTADLSNLILPELTRQMAALINNN